MFEWPASPAPIVLGRDHAQRFLASLNKDSNAHAGDPAANYSALIAASRVDRFEAVSNEMVPLEQQLADPASKRCDIVS